MSLLTPMNCSWGDLCNAAMRNSGRLGLGQTAQAQDIADVWGAGQMMLQEWQQKRWLIYHLVTYSLISTGAQSYTFGPGGQLNTNQVASWTLGSLSPLAGGTGYVVNDTITLTAQPASGTATGTQQVLVTGVTAGAVTSVSLVNSVSWPGPLPNSWVQASTSGVGLNATFAYPSWSSGTAISTVSGSQRPSKIESAYLRQISAPSPNQVDYFLDILQSHEDYDKIALKSMQSFPGAVFLDSQWPLGNLLCYPVPQASIYSMNVTVRETLPTQFATLATAMNLPFEYYSAIVYNLAIRCRPLFQIGTYPGDPLPGLATNSLNVLRGPNTQIARLVMPGSVMGRGPGYNIFSDRFYGH